MKRVDQYVSMVDPENEKFSVVKLTMETVSDSRAKGGKR